MATENLIFTSGLVESETEPSLGDFLYCNRKYYSLSNQRIPYMRDKTADEQFFILTLFEIAMEFDRKKLQAKNDIIKVNLLVGLPLAHYGLLYRKFERYFKSEGNIRFTYRKTSYTDNNRGCYFLSPGLRGRHDHLSGDQTAYECLDY